MNASFPATVTLRAIDFASICALSVNVDTTAGGNASSLVCELMSEDGYVIDGFGRGNNTAVPAGVSGTHVPLKWSHQLPVSLSGMRVMVRAHLTGETKLFALNLHTC